MTPRQLAQHARAALRDAADARVAKQQRSYFKPSEKIHPYGISTPAVRRIERELFTLVRKTWHYPDAVEFSDLLMQDRHIETKSLGLMLLARYHRHFEQDLLTRAKRWLTCDLCDNWAVTDQLSTQIISRVLDRDEKLAPAIEAWHRSPNLWVRRASAVSFVKPARRGRHLNHAYAVASALLPDRHDLIHKACGWLLREAGNADAARLEAYLLEHGPEIPRTAVRYAIERFSDDKRRKILERTRHKQEAEPR